MGIRFRKTKSFGGVKVSFGKKGLSSVSFGGKGARISFNTKGKIDQTVGIPGTGIYSQSTISGGKKNRQSNITANDIYSSSGKNPKPPKKHVVFLILGILVLVLTAFWSFGMFASQSFTILSFSLFGFFLSIGLFFLSLYGAFRHKKLMCILCAILFVVSFGVAMIAPSSDTTGTESTVSGATVSSLVESAGGDVDNGEQSDSTSTAQTDGTTASQPADTGSTEQSPAETTTSHTAPSTAPVIDTTSVEESSQASVIDTTPAEEPSQAPATDAPTVQKPQEAAPSASEERTVWIPTNGGKKYHTRSSCSQIKNPKAVTLSEAEASGYEPCQRCH